MSEQNETLTSCANKEVFPVSIRNYPASLCREQHSKDSDETFHSISFIYNGSWASFILNDGDTITPSTRRGGEPIPDHFDLSLGLSDDIRFVSIKVDEDSYERKPMFNGTIQLRLKRNERLI